MTGEGLRDTAPPPGRGRRALAGLRYVPLLILLLCVVVATLVGWNERSQRDDATTRQTTSVPVETSITR